MNFFLISILICFSLYANGERQSEFRLDNLLKAEQIGKAGGGGGRGGEDDRINQFPEVSNDIEFSCSTCAYYVDMLIKARHDNINYRYLKKIAANLCGFFGEKNRETCDRHVALYFSQALDIIDKREDLSGSLVCRILFQGHKCQAHDSTEEWQLNIAWNGPKIEAKQHIPNSTKYPLTIIQISDLHYDTKYRENSPAVCKSLICCRQSKKSNESSQIQSGKWGHYLCDTPWIAVADVLSQIQKTHKNIDFIYITGDYLDHGTWETNWDHIHNVITTIFNKIKEYFPNITVFPILGNHDTHPSNMFSPWEITEVTLSTQPLYSFIAEKWNWLPGKTIRESGRYSMPVRPGFRVIAINNNVCFVYNLWLLLRSNYIAEELQWLHDELLQAEKNNEKVHILAHVPSGNNLCYTKWAEQYNRIIERFYDIISAQFNGHTHRDHFDLYFAKDNPNIPINVAWNGGSVTTHQQVNPNYKVYHVETETYQVINQETWIYNLTEANEKPYGPRWFRKYQFLEEYNIPNLSPASLYELVQIFSKDYQKMQQYWRHYVKHGDLALKNGCDRECLANLLCDIVTTEFNDGNPRCISLRATFLNESIPIPTTRKTRDEF